MQKMNIKNFSEWKKWEERTQLKGLNFPGVYALSISNDNLTGKNFSLIKEIVYFGMTNSMSGLKGRLNQFNNTIVWKTGHGGAERFLYEYPKDGNLIKHLFVSVNFNKCNVNSNKPNDFLKMGEVANFEYICFALYVEKFGEVPKFNNKKLSPKRGK